MGGNHNYNCGNNDPLLKQKFTIIPFAGNADPKAYLDWKLAIEQKFNSHLLLLSIEFTSELDLCNDNNANVLPQTWNALKQHMKSHFVSSYYQRDLRLKFQTLKQGDKAVEEYYHEWIIGLARCNIHEDARILVLDFLVVCIVIYMISLIIKNGPGSASCIILLLKLMRGTWTPTTTFIQIQH